MGVSPRRLPRKRAVDKTLEVNAALKELPVGDQVIVALTYLSILAEDSGCEEEFWSHVVEMIARHRGGEGWLDLSDLVWADTDASVLP